jgi:hypothetical protein
MKTLDLAYALQELTMSIANTINISSSPSQFFKGWFPDDVSAAKGKMFFVKKKGRKIAIDIDPQERGNLNRLDKQSQFIYIPPNFDELFMWDALEQFHPLTVNDQITDKALFAEYARLAEEAVVDMVQQIERTEELYSSQALLDGIIQTDKIGTITFPREPESLVAYNAAHGWDVDTVSPSVILDQGARFLHEVGMVAPGESLVVIVGSEAWGSFVANPIRENEGDIRDQLFMNIFTGQPNGAGGIPHGSYGPGNFKFDLWGYEGVYDDPTTGNPTKYMDPKKIIILPRSQAFSMFYGGTKSIRKISADMNIPIIRKAKRNFYSVSATTLDPSAGMGVRSAPLAILDKVDSVFTAQVVAP